ncbi:Txe/YoeB family addiction module toxin [Pseudanabaena sp. SR411]|uniref:Txe/YoeB family addiction module toxin n=1 Tax=Pseudanabaena sp. SR411 TaxID=1980935 RepID=UPI000B981A6E|nr:Txe/YoeB family addiction module toxin [Pseudanabaena sp. SR411]OYQ63337.1 Txe/YoeB family addiction module toxin [Pseudanabaena sp. SR411]
MRNIIFEQKAFQQFNGWVKENKKVYAKIVELIDDTLRNPFTGIGKPEPLKHELKGCWSRRITDEHRLVYKVSEDAVIILSCKFHYEK